MTQADVPLPQKRGFGATSRRDRWWVAPAAVFLGLSAFIVYSTWAAWQGAHYHYDAYLSPMYSPLLWEASGHTVPEHNSHSLFGEWPAWLSPSWLPRWIPLSPAFFVLIFPAGFRLTCYYYRGAYYKSFWADPPSCAVGEPRKTYWGEQTWPLIAQNIHRYFFYAAAVFIVILSYDAIRAMFYSAQWRGVTILGDGGPGFGFGVGTFVLMLNVYLLGGYTFGCHSARHLIGGRFNVFSKHPVRKIGYDCVSCLNRQHMLWAWCSLFWVGFTDFYVRACSMGLFTDVRLF